MLSFPLKKLKLNFDTVFYSVTDMDASVAFYRDTLGPLVSQEFVARFDLDGVLFELVPRSRSATKYESRSSRREGRIDL